MLSRLDKCWLGNRSGCYFGGFASVSPYGYVMLCACVIRIYSIDYYKCVYDHGSLMH